MDIQYFGIMIYYDILYLDRFLVLDYWTSFVWRGWCAKPLSRYARRTKAMVRPTKKPCYLDGLKDVTGISLCHSASYFTTLCHCIWFWDKVFPCVSINFTCPKCCPYPFLTSALGEDALFWQWCCWQLVPPLCTLWPIWKSEGVAFCILFILLLESIQIWVSSLFGENLSKPSWIQEAGLTVWFSLILVDSGPLTVTNSRF